MTKPSFLASFLPLGDRVAIRPSPAKQKVGSLFIPSIGENSPEEGEIIAIGLGRMTDAGVRIPINLKVGDRVVFAPYNSSHVRYDGEELLILREQDLIAKVD